MKISTRTIKGAVFPTEISISDGDDILATINVSQLVDSLPITKKIKFVKSLIEVIKDLVD